MNCDSFEYALLHEDGELTDELMAHHRNCPACRMRMEVWQEISNLTPQMRREWESPDLWRKIRLDLASEFPGGNSNWRARFKGFLPGQPLQWQTVVALALVGLLSAALVWVMLQGFGLRREPISIEIGTRLLTERALEDVRHAEAEYAESIDRLSQLVEPKLSQPASPLLFSYREKLILLDQAISECRASIERNRLNAHLHRELLSIYQEKQRTLQELVREN